MGTTSHKVTIILRTSSYKPTQGILLYNKQPNEWSFAPGHKSSNIPIALPNFASLALSMIKNRKLFCGWKSTRVVLSIWRVYATLNIMANLFICRKVSVASLKSVKAPTSLTQHKLMMPEDKSTWDKSYQEEYDGLVNINTWEVIIDNHGKPDRAKYTIVVLGNLDPCEWLQSFFDVSAGVTFPDSPCSPKTVHPQNWGHKTGILSKLLTW